ncbi:ATP-dependent DNA helicase RecG [Asticcacaulis sp. YBE204]|uniref:ATP-dependent DNA helicase RecG n=1 Tax=Asticcacaulis sp. YBE204 TaxID=1282363 RepID=UPI0003C3D966|nr:ATP-dependent DNA helicase RecG [Asticcacaulis sp. YBE204]ESQ77060.1 ATP-dependent DNA helicase RecG [Asticcacaulis sp. YBE204]
MRPEILFPYYTSLTSLKGVGPKIAPHLIKHTGPYVRDLIFTLPSQLIFRPVTRIADARPGQVQTILVTIGSYQKAAGKGPQRVVVYDDTGQMQLTYFHAIRGFELQHPVGEQRWVSGRVESFGSNLQINHPDYVVPLNRQEDIPLFETVYPATAAVSSRLMRRFVEAGLNLVPSLPEWLDATTLQRLNISSFSESLRAAHYPTAENELSPEFSARMRLAYDEALAHQLAMKSRKQHRQASEALVIDRQVWAQHAIDALPFRFTNAQVRALTDIRADLRSGFRMNRLIQGDVGSGKTLVALMAMIDVAEAGHQSVMMAPTEILARQHYEKSLPILEKLGISTVLMTGRDKGKERESKRSAVANGDAVMVFGTHAVFQEGVDFKSLHFCVIDEQHRFGVGQRQKLFLKGESVHYLSMSATPIPRTLALTQYGEADLSVLDEKPAGRQPIHTAVIPRARLADVFQRLRSAIAAGSQAYWICPLVEENEESDLIAVEARHASLQEALGREIGLVHGRMASQDKEEVVARFASDELPLLCATTVVEVGIDVPNASIIIIEQAERFGLAQLHQLRGRVGRGAAQSACILLYDLPLGNTAKARLELLRTTEDGFIIAEMDWKLRGEGDILGARQSGFPAYRFVDPDKHADLIVMAAKEAQYIIEHEDRLPVERRKALDVLRHLFDWRPDISDKAD